MKIYLFGASSLGKTAFDFFSHYLDIEGFIDNNSAIVGTTFCGKTVYSPDILDDIRLHDEVMVYISSTYVNEIEEQLINSYFFYNYKKSTSLIQDLYFFSKFFKLKSDINDFGDFNELFIKIKNNNEVLAKSEKKKILIIANSYDLFVKSILMYSNKNKYVFNIFAFDQSATLHYENGYCDQVFIGNNGYESLCFFLKYTICYDIINIHSISYHYSSIIKDIRKKCDFLILSYWGSEFFRTSPDNLLKKTEMLNYSDVITFTSPSFVKRFTNFYKDYYYKCYFVNFGLPVLEYIKGLKNIDKVDIKKELNIPLDKVIITCGHAAIAEDNHFKIIDELFKLDKKIKEKLLFIFPLVRKREDGDEYIYQIKQKLLNSDLDYYLMTDFISDEIVAKYRYVSDIFITMQVTDSFSGTMQEYLATDTIVIAASWLPYEFLVELGIKFTQISAFTEINERINSILNNLDIFKAECLNNFDIIYNLSNPYVCDAKWASLFENVLNKE